MKKITFLTVFALFAFSLPSFAQIQQGNVLVGSTFSNLNWQLNSPHTFSFNITPEAAWFVQDNVAIGGYLNFGIQTASSSPTIIDYGVGALGRYYTGSDVSILKHGRLFAEATAGIGGVNISDGGGNTNGFDFGVGPGFAYFVTPNIGLETLLKYNGVLGFGSQTYQNNLTLNFGLQIYLPGKSTAKKVQGDIK
ncbi:outer membrane protein with beta-barrel domain [Mucilaginibacter frigoritolerans]|jgi:hypothetical protein|uniref:Outer membrane protein with beta-barrel domain n=1 Tax=Mucilaginibacter frigoritolerans TaxID=652788 RepID=A0A562U918_9SPHI|nr:outer membrane beta-barrel protein [Mucilaginibacter frigoritolerans]TWJ02292.1 outer membrane protein with beta-barrel domain [Mucilaginibacter frigoritolerans]